MIIYGKQPVFEALRSDQPLVRIYLAPENDPKFKNSVLKTAHRLEIEIEYIAKAQFQRITGPVLHQGIAAELKEFKYIDEQHLVQLAGNPVNNLFVILDQIQDPHNLGAIIRTAEIGAVNALIITEKGCADVNSTVAKTSAGAVFHLPVHKTSHLKQLIEMLRQHQIKIVGLEKNSDLKLYNFEFPGNVAFIVGSEGLGIRKNLINYCDFIISIPQFGKVNSLNASVSAAVALYEIIRQRKYTR